MTEEIKRSGLMHCWLMAKAEVAGRDYICLRGVNFRGEYREGPRAHEGGSRAHHKAPDPWLHVPTVAFKFNPAQEPPGAVQSMEKASALITTEWPALAQAKIIAGDQELTGKLGGTNAKGEVESVTRLAFDFGPVDRLPDVELKPGQTLPWPRHPVFWVAADEIADYGERVQQGAYKSAYQLMGRHAVEREIEDGKDEKNLPRIVKEPVTIQNMPFQQTVGDMFVKAFGPEIFTPRPAPPEKAPQPALFKGFAPDLPKG